MSWTYVRVARRTLTFSPGTNAYYDVKLELSNRGISQTGTGAGSTDVFPYVPPVDAGPMEFCCSTTGPGSATDIRSEETFRATFPAGPLASTARVHVPTWEISDTLPVSGWGSIEIAYSWDGGSLQYAFISADNYGAGGPYTGNLCWNGGGLSACSGTEGGTPSSPFPAVEFLRPDPTNDEVLRIFGIRGTNLTSGPTTFCLTVGDIVDSNTGLVVTNDVAAAVDPGAPAPAQPVPPAPPQETPDGVIQEFTTVWPYASGSLHVEFNGSRLEPGVDFEETDPAAGTFTFLTFTPSANAQIVVWYQGI